MTRAIGRVLVCATIASVTLLSQAGPDAPHWAYGYMKPPASGESAPPCPPAARPFPDCAYPVTPTTDDGMKRTLPGSSRSFTRNEAYFDYGPADWYPEDHPAMPDIVAKGKQADGVRACALCHYPNGQGKMENGGVAGLPAAYILQQLADFKSGARRSADPRKANTNEMAQIARRLTDEEAKAAADYFASMTWRTWVRVVESDQAPRVRATDQRPVPACGRRAAGAAGPAHHRDAGAARVDRTRRAIRARASSPTCRSASIAKGEAIVTTGGDGRTARCTVVSWRGSEGHGNGPRHRRPLGQLHRAAAVRHAAGHASDEDDEGGSGEADRRGHGQHHGLRVVTGTVAASSRYTASMNMSVVHATGRRAVAAVVVARRPRRFHLGERLALRDQILNAVANDRQHVAILDDVGFVGRAGRGRGRRRCRPPALSFGIVMSSSRFSPSMMPCTLPPLCDIDDRIGRRQEEIAARHDVRAAEEDDDVAVGVAGLVEQLNRFVVEEDLLVFAEERLGRPGAKRPRRRLLPTARSSASGPSRAPGRARSRAQGRNCPARCRRAIRRRARSSRSRRCDRRARAC